MNQNKKTKMELVELQAELKEQLRTRINNNDFTNDGSLVMRCHENIQWAWDNWTDVDLTPYYDDFSNKPENYTWSFAKMWIDNEPFEPELNAINFP